jgi:hypothetical protein
VLLSVAGRLPLTAAVAALACAVALLTAGEMAQSAAGWTLAYELAPTAARAQCLATFGLSTSAQFVAGPMLLTDAVIPRRTGGWLVLAGVFAVTSLITPAVIRTRVPGRHRASSGQRAPGGLPVASSYYAPRGYPAPSSHRAPRRRRTARSSLGGAHRREVVVVANREP